MYRPRKTLASAYDEGPVVRTIEKQTAKLPSDIFLWAAGASIIGSLVLQATKPSRVLVCHAAATRRPVQPRAQTG